MEDSDELLTSLSVETLTDEEKGKSKGLIIFVIILIVLLILIAIYMLVAYFAGLPPFSEGTPKMIIYKGEYFSPLPKDGTTQTQTYFDEGTTTTLTYQGVFETYQECETKCLNDIYCGAFSYNNPSSVKNQCWFQNTIGKTHLIGQDSNSVGGIKEYS